MDQLPALGTSIAAIARPTFAIYRSLLQKNADAIKATERKSFSYGDNPRQVLDVYYPTKLSKTAPVLVFFYGGGLVRGERVILGPFDGLVYTNCGYFFAEQLGYLTVIVDYRLISHGAKFPSGGEDVAGAVTWVKSNLVKTGETRDLILMGNSAGGIHMSTFLFSDVFNEARSSIMPNTCGGGVVLRGVVELSVPFHFSEADPARSQILKSYYGDCIELDCPLGLLRDAMQKNSDPLPGVAVLVLNGTLDPDDEILVPKQDFVYLWENLGSETARKALTVQMMEGHNHISPPLSLGTGIKAEEAWGYQIGTWVESVRS